MANRSKRQSYHRSQKRERKAHLITLLWLVAVICGLLLKRDAGDVVLAPVCGAAYWAGLPARRRKKSHQPNRAAATYSRFSCELQDETSIETQQERCEQAAKADGQTIDARFQFCDKAISGTKLHRDGLDALLAAAKAGLFNVLYFFSLSRLARESVIGLALIKRLVHTYKIRIVSVTEGFDTNREGWETLAQILLMQHERYIRELSENSFRGQKGNINNNFSNGDYCFGYRGEPVPGTETTRRGRHRKPRVKYVIDPINGRWVKKIFHWFVVERRSLRWITRELNRLQAPKDHRGKSSKWHHQCVSRLLGNIKVTGVWPWGRMKNSRDPESGQIYQEERPAEETRQWVREFPELRLVSDERFFKAQEILAKNAEDNASRRDEDGSFTAEQGEVSSTNPMHLLAGLIVCAVCGHRFYVGGAWGHYLFCPNYVNGSCSCRTMLRRDLAERLILEQISARILANSEWLGRILAATIAAWRSLQRMLPNELRDTEVALTNVSGKIRRLLDSIEGQGTLEHDVHDRIAERRAERDQLEDKLALLRQQSTSQPKEPTLAWVTERVQGLQDILTSSTPAAAFALRNLVGGAIVVSEMHVEGRKRRCLRGTFRIDANSVAQASQLGSPSVDEVGQAGGQITIDFLAANPLDAQAEQAKALWDKNLLGKEIAVELKCSRAQVSKLLKHWETLHGVKLPNAYARRMQIAQQTSPPLFQQIAERAYELLERGLLIAEVAAEIKCDINTVTKAARFWCESHGLPWIDGRTRRKGLDHKSRPGKDDDDRDGDQDDVGDAAPVPV